MYNLASEILFKFTDTDGRKRGWQEVGERLSCGSKREGPLAYSSLSSSPVSISSV